jgi:transcriptional regulator with XRE-family HTH domain
LGRVSSVPANDDFPDQLRRWRGARRVSQLELALRADVSARHVAFLERGRARPSRSMVLRLAAALDVPLSERNGLLGAAGFAPAYRARPRGDGALDLPEAALAWMLDRHAPYPGLALDRHWRIVRLNDPAARLLAAAGIGEGDSLLEATAGGGALRSFIANWPEVALYLSARLRTEIDHYGGDPVLSAYREEIAAEALDPPSSPASAILPIVYDLDGQLFAFFSTIAHFGGAGDIALDDLRIELMFPADEATASMLRGWGE